jgi:hypothetical protein
MKKFVVYIHWSQTDHAHYLVKATSKDHARAVIKDKLAGHYHIMGVSEITGDFT